jgi:hypothetical protein
MSMRALGGGIDFGFAAACEAADCGRPEATYAKVARQTVRQVAAMAEKSLFYRHAFILRQLSGRLQQVWMQVASLRRLKKRGGLN